MGNYCNCNDNNQDFEFNRNTNRNRNTNTYKQNTEISEYIIDIDYIDVIELSIVDENDYI